MGATGMTTTTHKELIEQFWTTLYERDFDRLESFFGPHAEYTDIGTPADDVAVGPEQIIRRLRLGVEPAESYTHRVTLMVAEGSAVVTEHDETWTWSTGESVTLPFVSVHVIEDGVILRWTDYWDLQTLLGGAPDWWIEHIAVGYV